LYPIVTQPVYLLESPWFSDIYMSVGDNATLRIVAHDLDDQAGSYYIRSIKINGVNWTKNWFEHDDVMVNGGMIEFFLGTEAFVWETGPIPPSPGHAGKPNQNGTYSMASTIGQGVKKLKRRDLGI
jgi:putative alpha-1,2-mannosidase